MKRATLAVVVNLAMTQTGAAQDGFYYGIGIGVTDSETLSDAVSTFTADGRDYSIALTAGYRFATGAPLSFGIEGNLDALTGKTMADPSGREACDNASPTWCEVDTVLRLRGTVSGLLANGSRIMASAGPVVVSGRAEEHNSSFKTTRGDGMSLGLSWENANDAFPVRIDLNVDRIRNDNLPPFSRTLDMVGLRASYMF